MVWSSVWPPALLTKKDCVSESSRRAGSPPCRASQPMGVLTETEEIDVTITNGAMEHPAWSRESGLLLAECKNWSTVSLVGQDLREAVRNSRFPELLEERHRQAILT